MDTWLKDANGNQCSIEFWGSKEAAQKALDSLENCENCTNCSGCLGCLGCLGCSDCSRCLGCLGCSGCSRCSDCSRCLGCLGCSHAAWLDSKQNLRGGPEAATPTGPPPVPVIENIHQTVFAAASNPKSLDMGTWHKCEKTHCRAGWVVTLAGEAGRALERFYDTPLAAMKIYDASSTLPKVSPVKFFDGNDEALADMKRMAELEKAQRAASEKLP